LCALRAHDNHPSNEVAAARLLERYRRLSAHCEDGAAAGPGRFSLLRGALNESRSRAFGQE
jgi:hypothetical protein